jgi:hypothetical protein
MVSKLIFNALTNTKLPYMISKTYGEKSFEYLKMINLAMISILLAHVVQHGIC